MDSYEKACLSYDQGDIENAFNLFLKGAREGNVGSMSRLALMYADGEGVDYDFEQSVYWDKKAAKEGSRSSLHNLAITYRTCGDIVSSKYWFEMAMRKGDGEAAYQLARLYMVSDKEQKTVVKLLDSALKSNSLCAVSQEEVQMLLGQYRNKLSRHPS